MKWSYIGAGWVVDADTVVVALDWKGARKSLDNRALVGYARSHGFLSQEHEDPKIMLVTSEKVMLLPGSLKSLRRNLEQT